MKNLEPLCFLNIILAQPSEVGAQWENLNSSTGENLAVKLRPSTVAPLLVVPNLNGIDPRSHAVSAPSRKTATTQRLARVHLSRSNTENLLAIEELYLLLPVTGRGGAEWRGGGGDVGSEESYDE